MPIIVQPTEFQSKKEDVQKNQPLATGLQEKAIPPREAVFEASAQAQTTEKKLRSDMMNQPREVTQPATPVVPEIKIPTSIPKREPKGADSVFGLPQSNDLASNAVNMVLGPKIRQSKIEKEIRSGGDPLKSLEIGFFEATTGHNKVYIEQNLPKLKEEKRTNEKVGNFFSNFGKGLDRYNQTMKENDYFTNDPLGIQFAANDPEVIKYLQSEAQDPIARGARTSWLTAEKKTIGAEIVKQGYVPTEEQKQRLSAIDQKLEENKPLEQSNFANQLIGDALHGVRSQGYILEANLPAAGVYVGGKVIDAGLKAASPFTGPAAPAVALAGTLVGGTTNWTSKAMAATEIFQIERDIATTEFATMTDSQGNSLDPDVVKTYSNIYGGVSAGLEYVSFGAIGKLIPGKEAIIGRFGKGAIKNTLAKVAKNPKLYGKVLSLSKRVVAGSLAEGSTEFLQELVSIVAEDAAMDEQEGRNATTTGGTFERPTWEDNKERLGSSAYMGAVAGGGMIAGGGAATHTASYLLKGKNDYQHVSEAQGSRDSLNNVNKVIQEDLSKEFAANPKATGEMIANGIYGNLGIKEAFVDAQGLKEVLGDDIQTYAQKLDIEPEAIEEAAKSGQDIKIPVGKYFEAFGGTKYFQGITEHARLNQQGMSPSEADEFTSVALEKGAELTPEEIQQEEQEQKSWDDLYRSKGLEIQQSGRSQKEADGAARIIADTYTAQAKRTGMSTEEYAKKHPLVVTGRKAEKPDFQSGNQATTRRFMDALTIQESGGNYEAVNEDTGASGRYQIMPDNWAEWSKEAGLPVGSEMTPENQDKVATHKMQNYFKKFGRWDLVAVAWYSGEQNAERLKKGKKTLIDDNGNEYSPDAKLSNGPSVNEYTRSVMKHMDSLDKREKRKSVEQLPIQEGIDWENVEDSHKYGANLLGKQLFDKIGIKSTISSGYRDEARNKAANGAENSWHLHKKAVDLAFDRDLTPEEQERVIKMARQAGFQEVLFHDKGSGNHLHIANLNENKSVIYGQPLEADIDLDEEILIPDITPVAERFQPSQKELYEFIQKAAKDQVAIPKIDLDLMVKLPESNKQIRHIAFAKPMEQRIKREVAGSAIQNLTDLIQRSILVEKSQKRSTNRDGSEKSAQSQKAKSGVENFYSFFVPVKFGQSDVVIKITGMDDNKGNIEFKGNELSIYEINPQNRKRTSEADNMPQSGGYWEASTSPSATTVNQPKGKVKSGRGQKSWKKTTPSVPKQEPAKITVRDMLAGFKDIDGVPYINEDGSGNFGKTYQQQNKGEVEITPNGLRLMTLFKKLADASTVIHESGHVFLANLAEDVLEPGATEGLKKDFDTVCEWLEVTDEQVVDGKVIFTEKQHEKFADGFMTYLAEGKAPSQGLVKVFRDFKNWLLNIYKNLGAMQEITPEVRGVFDRLVATEDQIRTMQSVQEYFAEKERQVKNLVGDEKAAKIYRELNEESQEVAKEKLTKTMMKDLDEEKIKWLADQRETIKKAVRKELIKSHPVYKAMNYLETASEENKIMKGSFEGDLADAFVSDKGELTAEDFAAYHGFESVEEMAMAFANTDPLENYVDQVANSEMEILEAGILAKPEELEEAIGEAYYNDEKVEALAAEMEILDKAQKDKEPLSERGQRAAEGLRDYRVRSQIAKNTAIRIIGSTIVKEISPRAYIVNARRYARKAMTAIQKGNLEVASRMKDLELLNAALANEAYKALQERDKILQEMKRLNDKKPDIGFTDDYTKPIQTMINAYQLLPNRKAPLYTNRVDLTEVVEFMTKKAEEFDFELDLPEWLGRGVILQENYKEIPMDKVRDIRTFIKRMEYLGKKEGEGKKEAENTDFYHNLDRVTDTIYQNKNRVERGTFERIEENTLKSAHYSHMKVESIVEAMDGYDEMGTIWRNIIQPLADAEGKRFTMMADYRRQFKQILDKNLPGGLDRLADQEYTLIDQSGGEHSIDGEKMISMALNWGNEGNRDRLARSFEGQGITHRDIEQFLNENMEKGHWDFVVDVWGLIDSYWPQIADLYKDWTGAVPEKILPAPIQTKFGIISGGYYPIVYDPESTRYAKMQEEKEAAAEIMGPQFVTAATRNGHTKARNGFAGGKLLLDLDVIDKHISNVIQDLSYGRAIAQVNRLISNDQFQNAVKETWGSAANKQFKSWLVGVARPDPPLANYGEKILRRFRLGTTIANMGFKVTTAMVQPLGATMAMPELGAARVAAAVTSFYKDFMTDPAKAKELMDFVMSQSAFMAERASTFDRDVSDTIAALKKQGKFGEVMNYAFYMAGFADLSITIPLWNEAYLQHMKKSKGNVADSVRYADKLIRQSQGSGNRMDLARIQRGSEAYKLFTMHYSFFNVLYNNFAKQVGKYRAGKTNFIEFATAMTWIWMMPVVLESLMKYGVGATLSALSGDEPEKDFMELLKDLPEDLGKFPLSSLVGIRDIVNATGPKGERFSYKISPVMSSGEALVNMINAGRDGDIEKMLKNAFRAGGTWYALPVRQGEASMGEVINWLAKDKDFSWKRFFLGGK